MIAQTFVPTRSPEPILGTRVLDLNISSEYQVAHHINRGFAPDAVERLASKLDVSVSHILELADIKSSTYHDRKRHHRPLTPEQSSRLYRIAQAAEAATRYFEGDDGAARRWLNGAKVALGGKSPLEFARTPEGSNYVVKLLGRMAHGVIS